MVRHEELDMAEAELEWAERRNERFMWLGLGFLAGLAGWAVTAAVTGMFDGEDNAVFIPECREGAPRKFSVEYNGETPQPAIERLRALNWTNTSAMWNEGYRDPDGYWLVTAQCEVGK